MRYLLLPILFVLMMPFTGQSQICIVNVSPQDTTICPGDSVGIVGYAAIVATGQNFNFDLGALPPGWSATGGSAWGNPCGSGMNGTPYYWASTSGGGVPTVGSPAFDVTCGGFLNFDMVFAVQGGSSPCEGPDEQDEGVSLQYSTDGGLTWIDIVYYSPGGFELPSNPGGNTSIASGATPYTTWGSFSVPIPVAAFTTNTMFQWTQINSSGTCCDNWGLDNIEIFGGPCNTATINWDNGLNNTNYFWTYPTQDTAFVAMVYDTLGNFMCSSDTINIYVYQNTMTYDLVDTLYAYCPTDILPASVTNFDNAIGPWSVEWSNGSTTNPTMFPTNGNGQDLILFTVDVTDGCGYVTTDSVYMKVNQTLAMDTILTYPSSACNPTGALSAFVTGVTNANGQPYYHWTGPGNPGSYNVDGTAIQNIPSGWYYFTVIDDVCEVFDSAFVDILLPPMASFTADIEAGCSPLTVTFTNTSQNTTTYTWDFGNGIVQNANSSASQTQTFVSSSLVTLTGYDASGCPDEFQLPIAVQPCGCMDPSALNYEPTAVFDDGSCIFPYPTVIAPNIFTPNGDQINDFFVLDVTNQSEVHLIIMNRWGNTVFDQRGTNVAWNGIEQNGFTANEGTYFYKYIVKGVSEDIEPLEGHGFLQLVRK